MSQRQWVKGPSVGGIDTHLGGPVDVPSMSPLRRKLRNRETVVASWVSLGHPAVAEIMAAHGYDFILIDLEHTDLSLADAANHIRAIEAAAGPTVPIVRVPWNDPVWIKRVLDLGPAGILVPMVEDADEARAAVEATRYPPEGIRGVAGGRASGYGERFVEYVDEANENVAVILQTETERSIENAGEIGAVDGVDGLFIGPSDLSKGLDAFAEWADDRVTGAVETIVTAGHDADVSVGTLAVTETQIRDRIDWDVDFMIVGTDARFVRIGSSEAKATFEAAVDGT